MPLGWKHFSRADRRLFLKIKCSFVSWRCTISFLFFFNENQFRKNYLYLIWQAVHRTSTGRAEATKRLKASGCGRQLRKSSLTPTGDRISQTEAGRKIVSICTAETITSGATGCVVCPSILFVNGDKLTHWPSEIPLFCSSILIYIKTIIIFWHTCKIIFNWQCKKAAKIIAVFWR